MKKFTWISIFILIGFLISLMCFHGYIISTLWGWFVVPLGMKPITFVHGMGISVFVGLFKTTIDKTTLTRQEYIQAVFKPFTVLILGWIVHLCM